MIEHRAERRLFASSAALTDAYKRSVPAFNQSVLYAADQFGRERVGDIGQQDSDHLSLLTLQGSRQPVGVIVEFLYHPHDLFAHCLTDVTALIDDARNGHRRDTRFGRNVDDCRMTRFVW